MANCAVVRNGFTFLWIIENYNMHVVSPEFHFESPTFMTRMFNNSKWRLKLHPYNENHGYLRIEIEKVDDMADNTYVEISFHLVTDRGDFFLDSISYRKFEFEDAFFLRFTKKKFGNDCDEDLSQYLVDDSLKLKCHFWNEGALAFQPVVCTALTSFNIEKHSFNWSFKGFQQYKIPKFERIIFPKMQEMPCIKVTLRHDYDLYHDGEISSYLTLEILNPDRQKCYRVKMNCSAYDNNGKLLGIEYIDWFVTTEYKEKFFLDPKYILKYKTVRRQNEELKLFVNLAVSSDEVRSQIDHTSHCPIHNSEISTQSTKEVEQATTEAENVVKKTSSQNHIPNSGIDTLADDLGRLLTDQKFCDVKLIVDGKEFLAHKSILAARSPVFSTMLESDMMEKETGKVNIDDIDSETFGIFLNYLYVGKIDNLTVEKAVSLYSAADKYDIIVLKNECSSFILNHLSAKNVCEVLVLSDMHQDKELKKAAQEAFRINCKAVLLSTEWAVLLQKKPELGAEVLKEMAGKMK